MILFHIEMVYTGSNSTLHTTITCNGEPFDPIPDAYAANGFQDFRVDQIAVSSYSDAIAGVPSSPMASWTTSSSPSRRRRCRIWPEASATRLAGPIHQPEQLALYPRTHRGFSIVDKRFRRDDRQRHKSFPARYESTGEPGVLSRARGKAMMSGSGK